MWFRNLIVYRLPDDWSMSAAELEQRLEGDRLRPCGALEMQSRGWVESAPTGRLVHTVAGHHLIALGVDQKLLPSSIVRQVAKERAAEIAAEQGFPVGRRQMRDLKMRVLEELRARALTRRGVTRAWIDPQGGLVRRRGVGRRARRAGQRDAAHRDRHLRREAAQGRSRAAPDDGPLAAPRRPAVAFQRSTRNSS